MDNRPVGTGLGTDGGFDAVVLAGGAARRLGGAVKPQVQVGGIALLDHALAAVSGAARIVVAGPAQPAHVPVTWVREDPPGSGPVAALAAALPLTTRPTVVVLAADLPRVAGAVPVLLAAVPIDGVALLVDPTGRRNHLAAAWNRATLDAALSRIGPPAGAAVRSLLDGLPESAVVEVDDRDGWGTDCDTWDDVAAARRRAHPPRPGARGPSLGMN